MPGKIQHVLSPGDLCVKARLRGSARSPTDPKCYAPFPASFPRRRCRTT